MGHRLREVVLQVSLAIDPIPGRSDVVDDDALAPSLHLRFQVHCCSLYDGPPRKPGSTDHMGGHAGGTSSPSSMLNGALEGPATKASTFMRTLLRKAAAAADWPSVSQATCPFGRSNR